MPNNPLRMGEQNYKLGAKCFKVVRTLSMGDANAWPQQ